MESSLFNILSRFKKMLYGVGFTTDTFFFLIVVTILNLNLLHNRFNHSLVFMPYAFENGCWWQLMTHPFVHLSPYHLALDAGAFFILYTGLREQSIHKKLLYVISCGFSSLLAALLFSPDIYTKGLCGLSGIAHGLMAVGALEMVQEKKHAKAGLFSLFLVVGKCVYEVLSGQAVFLFMHMGLCGTPLVVCHAGGAAGGIVVFFIFRIKFSKRPYGLFQRN